MLVDVTGFEPAIPSVQARCNSVMLHAQNHFTTAFIIRFSNLIKNVRAIPSLYDFERYQEKKVQTDKSDQSVNRHRYLMVEKKRVELPPPCIRNRCSTVKLLLEWSGSRESNSGLMLPKHGCYRNNSPRLVD